MVAVSSTSQMIHASLLLPELKSLPCCFPTPPPSIKRSTSDRGLLNGQIIPSNHGSSSNWQRPGTPPCLPLTLPPPPRCCRQIATASQLEPPTRSLAAECLVTLCEARDKAPGMVRRLPNFVGSLFEALMNFLLDIEDEPDWHRVRRGGRRSARV